MPRWPPRSTPSRPDATLLRFTVRYLPERQALAYADARPKGLDVALSIVAAGGGEPPSPVFDGVLQSRSLILDEIASRARSAARLGSGARRR